MSKTILAGVLALFLGPGATLSASAEPSSSADPDPRVIQFLGWSFCLEDAPADATCDWRAPAREPVQDGLALTLFGTRYCLGDETACGRDAQGTDGTFRLLGMTWCRASTSKSQAGCDVVLPERGTDSPARDMHASR